MTVFRAIYKPDWSWPTRLARDYALLRAVLCKGWCHTWAQ